MNYISTRPKSIINFGRVLKHQKKAILNQLTHIILLLLLVGFILPTTAQEEVLPSDDDSYERIYQKRIKRERLNGVYIPKDLTDCFIQLNRLIDNESKAKFRAMSEEAAAQKLHFSLGRWIIHNWGFYTGSRLSHYLRDLGVSYPDDMARFIIISYHRNLNRKKLNIKEQLTHYKRQLEQRESKRREEGTVIHEETRKRPKNE